MKKSEIKKYLKRGAFKKWNLNDLLKLKKEVGNILKDVDQEIDAIEDDVDQEEKLLDLCDYRCSINTIYTTVLNEISIKRLRIDREGYRSSSHISINIGKRPNYSKEKGN